MELEFAQESFSSLIMQHDWALSASFLVCCKLIEANLEILD